MQLMSQQKAVDMFFQQATRFTSENKGIFVALINFKSLKNDTSKTFDRNFYLNQPQLTLPLIDLIKAVYLIHVCIYIYYAGKL